MTEKFIAVVTTGGTIMCEKQPDSDKVTPKMTGLELLDNIEGLTDRFNIKLVEHSNMPGSDLSPNTAFKLKETIVSLIDDPSIMGIVVTQGTDAMDEIPYLIHLTCRVKKPIVFTGAMKGANDLYSDAVGNVYGSILVASSREAIGKGVLVYFNETVFSASDVEKFNANRIDAFDSFRGPMGRVLNDRVTFFREPVEEPVYDVWEATDLVPIIKIYSGMTDLFVRTCIDKKVKAIVIEGYGSGNVPFDIEPAIREARSKGIIVAMSTRCFYGDAYGCYDYIGGGAQLSELGVIFGGGLSSQKTRLKLLVMLAAGRTVDEISNAFSLDY